MIGSISGVESRIGRMPLSSPSDRERRPGGIVRRTENIKFSVRDNKKPPFITHQCLHLWPRFLLLFRASLDPTGFGYETFEFVRGRLTLPMRLRRFPLPATRTRCPCLHFLNSSIFLLLRFKGGGDDPLIRFGLRLIVTFDFHLELHSWRWVK
jgi:hypothetical protein